MGNLYVEFWWGKIKSHSLLSNTVGVTVGIVTLGKKGRFSEKPLFFKSKASPLLIPLKRNLLGLNNLQGLQS